MAPCRRDQAIVRFAGVNRPDQPGFRKGWQKHHLLPRQLLTRRCLATMLAAVSPGGMWFDDFGTNGVLLPGTEAVAEQERLPLHRGPHKVYNELVFERIGAVEMEWSRIQSRDERQARHTARARIGLIQRALSRRLRGEGDKRLVLNSRDPIGRGIDYADLDAMAEQIWGATGPRA